MERFKVQPYVAHTRVVQVEHKSDGLHDGFCRGELFWRLNIKLWPLASVGFLIK